MNEKERYEHLNETVSLVITPLVKEIRRNLKSLFILNILGNIILISLVSAMIALLLLHRLWEGV